MFEADGHRGIPVTADTLLPNLVPVIQIRCLAFLS